MASLVLRFPHSESASDQRESEVDLKFPVGVVVVGTILAVYLFGWL